MTVAERVKQIERENRTGKQNEYLSFAEYRKANRYWLRTSTRIALEVMDAMEQKGITKEQLADKLGVSLHYVNTICKGQEDLPLSVLCGLQDYLGIKLFFKKIHVTYANKTRNN